MKPFCALLWMVLAIGAGDARAQSGIWPMKGYDVRRTGQSSVNGPLSIDPSRSWTVALPGAHTVNIGATVTETAAFVGSWGLLRRTEDADPRFWDKSDGAVYGFDIATGDVLFDGRLDLDLVPRCYDYPDRSGNLLWCGFTPYTVSYYNGTVEGQAAYDVGTNRLYVGRGDGKLYAIDADRGDIVWRFTTFNPLLPDDPDGGGEIVTGPLVDEDGVVYFGTWGEGPYETNAVYAVASDGEMRWRFPAELTLSQRIFASPALSPDESTLYVASYYEEDETVPATLYALHRTVAGVDNDETRLKWAMPLQHDGAPVHAATLAVGSDGTIFVGGFAGSGPPMPVVTAVNDLGDRGAYAWNDAYAAFDDGSQYVLGIALREVDRETRRMYVTTSSLRSLFSVVHEGSIFAVDIETGNVLASFDPTDDAPDAIGGLTSPALGADGTIYFGVQGKLGEKGRPGHYFGVTYDEAEAAFSTLWRTEVEGYVEWNHPAIGPDGGLYVGSSSLLEDVRQKTYYEDEIPDGSTAWFHALKGPTSPVGVDGEYDGPEAETSFFPNPFAAEMTVQFAAHPHKTTVVDVYDPLGRLVRRLAGVGPGAGMRAARWDGTSTFGHRMANGVYLVVVSAGEAIAAHGTVVLAR